MATDAQLLKSKRWVRINATYDQRYVCPGCASKRKPEEMISMVTLRVAMEDACCVDCRQYNTWGG